MRGETARNLEFPTTDPIDYVACYVGLSKPLRHDWNHAQFLFSKKIIGPKALHKVRE